MANFVKKNFLLIIVLSSLS